MIGAARVRQLSAMPGARQVLIRPRLQLFSTASFNKQRDYYRDLGVTQHASHSEIKRKFYELAKKHHPDSNQSKASDEERFK